MRRILTIAAVTIIGLVAVALVYPLQAYAAAQATTASQVKADDDTLQSTIEANLKKNSVLATRDIDVDVDKGVVTLSGTVRTATEKSRAARAARVAGVTKVVNEIEIDPNVDRSKIDTAGDKTKSGLNKAVDATVGAAHKAKEAVQAGVGKSEEGAAKAADKTANAVGAAGDKLGDASVTTKVKSGFSNEPLLQNAAIEVTTTDHVVTLRGTVPSAAGKERAAQIAAQTEGVNQVVNELAVVSR